MVKCLGVEPTRTIWLGVEPLFQSGSANFILEQDGTERMREELLQHLKRQTFRVHYVQLALLTTAGFAGMASVAADAIQAATRLQSVGYEYADTGGPVMLQFAPFDEDDGRKRLTKIDISFQGDLAMDVLVENYDPVAYSEGEWQVELFQTVLFAFDATNDYPDGGPFYWLGGISEQGITGDLSAGSGGNPFEPGTPGEVKVSGSASGTINSTVQVATENFDYFLADSNLSAQVGAFSETLISPPPGSSFINAGVTRAEQNGLLSLIYTFEYVGDVNDDEAVDASDIDLLYRNLDGSVLTYDLNEDDQVDLDDVDHLVLHLLDTHYGDANLDGRFDTSDLVTVFQAGEYEDDVELNSTWSSGDWNGDAEFNSSDIVFAFERSGAAYEVEPSVAASAAVPEPTGIAGWIVLLPLLARSKRR